MITIIVVNIIPQTRASQNRQDRGGAGRRRVSLLFMAESASAMKRDGGAKDLCDAAKPYNMAPVKRQTLLLNLRAQRKRQRPLGHEKCNIK